MRSQSPVPVVDLDRDPAALGRDLDAVCRETGFFQVIGHGVVATADGSWTSVPSVPGAFVVNIGDLMARWTNDRWRSTLHRVVDPAVQHASGAPSYPQRQSMPFFHNANWGARRTALPTCVTPGEAPRQRVPQAQAHFACR